MLVYQCWVYGRGRQAGFGYKITKKNRDGVGLYLSISFMLIISLIISGDVKRHSWRFQADIYYLKIWNLFEMVLPL